VARLPQLGCREAISQRRGLLLGSRYRVSRELAVLVVAAANGALELPESLAECATRVGEALGAKEDEREDEQDDQVGGL